MTLWQRIAAFLAPGRPAPEAPPVTDHFADINKMVPGVPKVAVGEAPGAPLLTGINSGKLAQMLRAVEMGDPDAWAKVLAAPMRETAIDTPRRMAAFLANVAHESGGGRVLAENLSYSADRLRAVWPARFPDAASAEAVARKPEAIANAVYGKRMGNTAPSDGWRYRGRGLIQITGRANYEALGYADDPAWLETREGAAVSACRYWSVNGLNATADTGDIEAVRRRVNGGLIGLDDVRRRYKAALG